MPRGGPSSSQFKASTQRHHASNLSNRARTQPGPPRPARPRTPAARGHPRRPELNACRSAGAFRLCHKGPVGMLRGSLPRMPDRPRRRARVQTTRRQLPPSFRRSERSFRHSPTSTLPAAAAVFRRARGLERTDPAVGVRPPAVAHRPPGRAKRRTDVLREHERFSSAVFSTVSPFARRRSTVCTMSSVMTGGRSPFPLCAAASSPSRVGSRMYSRSVSAIAAKNPNSRRPGPLGPYIPCRGPASSSRTRQWAAGAVRAGVSRAGAPW